MHIKIKGHQNFTQKAISNAGSSFIQFPVTRIVIALLFIAPAVAFHNVLAITVLEKVSGLAGDIIYFIETLLFILFISFLNRIYTRVIEGRKSLEFDFKGGFKEFSTGAAVGATLVTVMIILLVLCRFYSIEKVNKPYILLYGVFRYGSGAFLEEVIFTIITYKLVEELIGTKWSVILVSLLFGLAHTGNDNISLQNLLLMSLSHVLVIASYIFTRRIWMIWAIHFSWNYFQTAIFGLSNSGMAQGGFITPVLSGPDWFTGGGYGIEASYISVTLNLIAGLLILWQAVKSGQTINPLWIRNKVK